MRRVNYIIGIILRLNALLAVINFFGFLRQLKEMKIYPLAFHDKYPFCLWNY